MTKVRGGFGPRLMASAALLALAAGSGMAQEPPRNYALTIASHVEIRMQNQPKAQEVDVSADVRYTLTPVAGGVEVTVREMGVRVGSPGHNLVDSKLSKAGASFRQGDQKATTYEYAQAPPDLKKVLDEFDRPIARLKLDDRGAETGRELLVDPSNTLVEHGVLANCRLFHPPFPTGASEWDAPAEVSLSSGQFAKGTLHYEKSDVTEDGLTRVKVSGELKAEGKIQGGEIRDALYKVSGEEFYDPKAKAWVSGLMELDLSFLIATPSQPPGSAKGRMEIRLKQTDQGEASPTPP